MIGKLVHLPEKVNLFKPSQYVIMSMADGWITDKKYGSFNDMVKEWNGLPKQKGDPLLTIMRITRDDAYEKTRLQPYYNNRGRGDRNRTYDAELPSCSVLPLNQIDRNDKYRMVVEKFDGDKSLGFETWDFTVKNHVLRDKNVKGWDTEDLRAFMDSEHSGKTFWGGYQVKVRKVEFIDTRYRYFISARKECSAAYANIEVFSDEIINLAFADSVRIRHVVQSRNIRD